MDLYGYMKQVISKTPLNTAITELTIPHEQFQMFSVRHSRLDIEILDSLKSK